MEKSSLQRDLEDWELLGDDYDEELFDLAPSDRGKSLMISTGSKFRSSGRLVDINYFVCPPYHPPHVLVAAPEELLPAIEKKEEEKEEACVEEVKEVISHVSFRKLGESEFVDMKLDSPTARGSKLPLVEAPRLAEEEVEEEEEEEREEKKDSRELGCQQGKNSWIIGALCSIGVAAATVFIIVLGGPPRERHRQKMQFQIFADEQMAARLNQVMSAARGVPTTRAHISFGGYYDGL